MAKITCAISSITFTVDHFTSPGTSFHLANTDGYFHPVFAAPHTTLHKLYAVHTAGKLTPTDSYLLFLSFLHSSQCIHWKHPATLDPRTPQTRALIENNLSQLLSVLARTDIIVHPSFKQPKFVVNHNNSDLSQITNWIAAWDSNIEDFYTYRASQSEQEELQAVLNKLSLLILSGEEPKKYAHVIADWASLAGEFPAPCKEEYKRTIRSCFNETKMFNTPLALLKEIKEYCETNIAVGSIHFHALTTTLKTGIRNHVDYLGTSSLSLGYTLLPDIGDAATIEAVVKNEKALASVLITAPTSAPVATDYSSSLEFLRARLAYKVASRSAAPKPIQLTPAPTANNINLKDL